MIISEANWNYLLDEQKKLDAQIMEKMGLKCVAPWERVSAFKIEVAEAVNELKGYIKFWSVKAPNRELFLEETIDALHFALGIELAVGSKHSYHQVKNYYIDEELKMQKQATNIKDLAHRALMTKDWLEALAFLLRITRELGFDEIDVMNAYKKKNSENQRRSESGTY